jgi:hypothetical protein
MAVSSFSGGHRVFSPTIPHTETLNSSPLANTLMPSALLKEADLSPAILYLVPTMGLLLNYTVAKPPLHLQWGIWTDGKSTVKVKGSHISLALPDPAL